MQIGNQRFPHKYISRIKRNGRYIYVYNDGNEVETKSLKVVIAQGKPTQLLVDARHNFIVTGPPNLIGRKLLVNNNPNKSYYARAYDPSGNAPTVYCYPESHIKTVVAKKAAKFVKQERAFECLNKSAEAMMKSNNHITRDYGLAIWLNNNSQMRIGAHSDASSVDPKERQKIINLARQEGWSDATKQEAFRQAREHTYGLLTLRKGHVRMDSTGKAIATFAFLGKGGKENVYSVEVPPLVKQILFRKLYVDNPEPSARFFHKKVNYKRIWREYKKYGVTPHISRGAFASSMIRSVMKEFKVTSADTAKSALARFNAEITAKVSDKLNHTRNVTEKSYLSPMAKKALEEFRTGIKMATSLQEAIYSPTYGITPILGEVLLWRELGVGNTVI